MHHVHCLRYTMAMKISRLLGIVTLLLNREKMTAKELAENFEVSVRTILRDLEALDQAGIPVVTTQGQGGGVGLMEGFTLDRQYFSVGELASVFTALEGISSLIDDPEYQTAKEKLSNLVTPGLRDKLSEEGRILNVDMSPWSGSERHGRYLNILLEAAQAAQQVSFCYTNVKGECVERCVEPYQLLFKGSAWYMAAYCLLRNDFRMFRLSRMRDLRKIPKRFERREIPQGMLDPYSWDSDGQAGGYSPPNEQLVLRFSPKIRYRLEDFFGSEMISEIEDGTLEVKADFPEDEWVYSFLLSFGPDVEVLRPLRIREIINRRASAAAEKNSC